MVVICLLDLNLSISLFSRSLHTWKIYTVHWGEILLPSMYVYVSLKKSKYTIWKMRIGASGWNIQLDVAEYQFSEHEYFKRIGNFTQQRQWPELGTVTFKGSVSRMLRWVLFYVNQKLSLRPIIASHKILILVKGQFTIYTKQAGAPLYCDMVSSRQ